MDLRFSEYPSYVLLHDGDNSTSRAWRPAVQIDVSPLI